MNAVRKRAARQALEVTEPSLDGTIMRRIGVTVERFAASPFNGDMSAYLHKPKNGEWGLEPWFLIEGVDPHTRRADFDIWGASGWCRTVGPGYLIYLSEKDFERFNAQA